MGASANEITGCAQPKPKAANSYCSLEPLLLRAFRGDVLERPPVWMMRQAGRYMSEYQAVRQRATFLEICKTPELAVEVTLQPLKAFGFDASIIFSDILIPLEAMGLELEVTDAKGPQFLNPVRSNEAARKLGGFDPTEKTPFLLDALRQMRRELQETGITLIGFAGAPWTLASYAVEGTSWKTGQHFKQWLFEAPDEVHAFLEKLTQQLIGYLVAQAEAGAQVLMVFDTWAGMAPDKWYEPFIHRYHQRLIAGVKAACPNVPVILFAKQARDRLGWLAQTGADALSIDEWTDLDIARQRIKEAGKPKLTLQGNLDSAALFVNDPSILKTEVERVLRQGGQQHFIFNLGHGVLPKTPRENVAVVVNWVKDWSGSKQSFLNEPA